MKNESAISHKPQRPFSVKARLRSFGYAFEGINAFFQSQHNAIIHLVLTIAAIAAGIFFNISRVEMLAIVIASGCVWAAELFNTAIERLADVLSKEHHPDIKFVKDISAAAVLLTAVAACITAAIIFIPKLS